MKVVTYNIQWGMGKDGVIDLPRIAQTVHDADIICLQEVEVNWRDGDGADQVSVLASLFPDHYLAFAPAVDIHNPSGSGKIARRQYGVLTLSRWPILSARAYPLPKYPVVGHLVDQTVAQELIIKPKGSGLRIYNTHLNYLSQAQRIHQVEVLLKLIEDAPKQGGPVSGLGVGAREYQEDWMAVGAEDLANMPLPAILLGDFNMRPNAPEYDLIVGQKDPYYGRLHKAHLFSDALTLSGLPEEDGKTHIDENNPNFNRIDHIFVSGDLVPKVKKAWIDEDAIASDHQPIFAEINWP